MQSRLSPWETGTKRPRLAAGHMVIRMGAIHPEVDPPEVGLDPTRLDFIGRHFERYVADRKIPGFLAVVTRWGRVAYVGRGGFRDLEIGAPVETDTRFRIYSMTKPVTSVAAMICCEQGLIALDDPLSKFIPEFGETRVFAGGSSLRPVTVPMSEPIRIWHLMTHTAGLTYGWMFSHPVDAMYRSAGFEWDPPVGFDLAGCCSRLAQIPLRCQPGTEWNYSMATDVLGRVVEIASGQSFEDFLKERVLAPLNMTETGFYVEGTTDDDWTSPDAIRQASFRECDLRGTRFVGTNLFRIDFRGSELDVGLRRRAILEGAIVD